MVRGIPGGIQKLGWTEGRNIRIDTRWVAPDDAESMQRFAKELVALQPGLILSSITPTTAALLQETRTIPIVFAMVADPVGSGFKAAAQSFGVEASAIAVQDTSEIEFIIGALTREPNGGLIVIRMSSPSRIA